MIPRMLFLILATSVTVAGCTAKQDLGSHGDGGADGAPVPLTVLASNQNSPWSIRIDDNNVYWVNASPLGGIYKVPKSGGAVVELAKGQYGNVESFGVDATNVYMPFNNTIIAQPIAGGASSVIESTTTSLVALAVANGNLYWLDRDSSDSLFEAPVAELVSTAGGTPAPFTLPSGISAAYAGHNTFIGTDGVYIGQAGGPDILRLPFGGGSASVISVLGSLGPFGADDTTVYFAVPGAVESIPKAGGTATPLAATQNATSIVVDGDYLYVADDTPTGRILKMPKSGSPITVLADNQGAPHSIAVDATSVYWNCIDEGTIKKIGK